MMRGAFPESLTRSRELSSLAIYFSGVAPLALRKEESTFHAHCMCLDPQRGATRQGVN